MSNYGRRAFSYAGPHAWNLLAENVRKSTSIAIFKCSLKTFLFEEITHSVQYRWFSFCLMGYTSVLSNSKFMLLHKRHVEGRKTTAEELLQQENGSREMMRASNRSSFKTLAINTFHAFCSSLAPNIHSLHFNTLLHHVSAIKGNAAPSRTRFAEICHTTGWISSSTLPSSLMNLGLSTSLPSHVN